MIAISVPPINGTKRQWSTGAILSGIGLAGAMLANVARNFLQALGAILVGNAIYFLVLWPYLPPQARHGIDRIDLGLLVDFSVCAICFGIVKFILRKKRP